MAPRPGPARERDIDFSAVGKVGRRTGTVLPPRPIDENGLEEVSHIFSSPRKPSPLKNSMSVLDAMQETSTSESSADMTGINSSGLTPKQALSTRKSLRGASIPPRSASPRKSGISGTARRSNTIDLLAPNKGAEAFDPEDRENTPMLSPSRANRAARRFSPSPEKAPLRDITVRNVSAAGSLTAMESLFEPRSEVMLSVEAEEDAHLQDAISGAEAGADPEDEDYAPALGDDEELFGDAERLHSPSVELAGEYDDEDADQTFEPEPATGLSAREHTKANSTRKRKSDAFDRDAEIQESSPAAKRSRREESRQNEMTKQVKKSAASKSAANASQNGSKSKGQPVKSKNTGPQMSARQQKEVDDYIERVKARPGQTKSLYILRRETPADDGVSQTRSGRTSFKPLAWWRNERCVYGGSSPAGPTLQDGARFPLNSIKEIIRTEEIHQDLSKKRKKRRQKGKGKSKAATEDSESSDLELDEAGQTLDPDAEPWESEIGAFRGPVSVWDPQQQAPIEEEEEVDIAYAPAAIQTREQKGSSQHEGPTFRYAKLLSTKFFGTGIVDLPPGGIKRPKNSRKMHMSFFVVKGRVTVQVGPIGGEETGSFNRFSVGKGGFWQVPRGNQYSIENEFMKSARIFFSQGCESAPQDED